MSRLAQSDRESASQPSSIVTSRSDSTTGRSSGLHRRRVGDRPRGRRRSTGRPEETRETRHVLFSSTKPYAAVTLHSLVEEGELAYDDRVVDHWPEFAAEGSEKADITVRQVLSHTSGLNRGEIDDRPDLWGDWDAVVEQLEAMEPNFPPGRRRPITP